MKFSTNFESDLLKEADKHMSDTVKKTIHSVVCKVHNERPVIESITKSNNELKLNVKYCCDGLEDQVSEVISK